VTVGVVVGESVGTGVARIVGAALGSDVGIWVAGLPAPHAAMKSADAAAPAIRIQFVW
jgi:hypothetical protein